MITVAHIDEQRGLRGGEQQASWLVRGLSEHRLRNVLVGKRGEAFLQMYPEDTNLCRVPLALRGEWDIASALRLSRMTRELHVDIVHAHTSHAHGIAVLAAALGMQSRLVVSRRVNFMPGRHWLNRKKYYRADRILCVSEAVRNTLVQYGLPEEKLRTVHSSVDMERACMPPVPRKTLGINENAPFLFTAGSLVGHKDHNNLLVAFAEVKRTFPEAQLCIAGEGPLRDKLEETKNNLGLGDCVFLLGHRHDSPGIARNADVYVSSSWSEGLGTSILEALAAGVPVVATEAGGAREMVVHGETGLVVPVRNPSALAQAICESLKNRRNALVMAGRGKDRVKSLFSVTEMVRKTLEAYEETLGLSSGQHEI